MAFRAHPPDAPTAAPMTSPTRLILTPGVWTPEAVRSVVRGGVRLEFAGDVWARVQRSADTVGRVVAQGVAVYGVNTGFGKLAKTRIADAKLSDLQRNLLRSHAVGTGPVLELEVVRLILALKIGSLARGASGVRPVVLRHLIALLEADALPVVPAKGSVGASGDLAPLSHLSLPLLGEGTISWGGAPVPAAGVLHALGLPALELAPKEGLALINGTQVSTAIALVAWLRGRLLLESAVAIGGLSVDAARGSDAPFDPRIHALRGQPGQIRVAAALRMLLDGSEIRRSHLVGDDRVQDPYSLRCQPQVLGACLDALESAGRTLLIEAGAVTDNPLVFDETDEILSGGNFHAEPVALAADHMALALAEIGSISERKVALLIDANLSGLPPFLVDDPGLHSGFMIAHVTAAALASENKSLAHPASVDSLPTSANQEDHVSMATFAAYRLLAMVENTATILAIEWLAAAQGIDYHRPLRTSSGLEPLMTRLRERIPRYGEDRFFAPDVDAAKGLVLAGAAAALPCTAEGGVL
jgi:histidine ammonia-lyase